MKKLDKNLQKAEKLVNQYLKLLEQRDSLEEKFLKLKDEISSFSKNSHLKTLKSGKNLLYVSSKKRTMFPKVDEKGRKQVEEIMRKSKEWQHAITFDIIKLGMAYDKKKLSVTLRKKLKPFTHKEEFVRLYTKEIEKDKEKEEKD